MAKKKYTFEITQGTLYNGNPYWGASMHRRYGSFYGFSYPCDSREEAENKLYDYQEKNNIPDNDIEWIGIKPKQQQMELF